MNKRNHTRNEIAMIEKRMIELKEKDIKLRSKEARKKNLGDELKFYQDAYDKLKIELAKLNSQIDLNERKCSKLDSEIEALEDNFKVKRDDLNESQNELKKIDAQLEDLNMRATNLRMECEKYGAVSNRVSGKNMRFVTLFDFN